MKIAAIIPARMGSSRFPGKSLLPFRGVPMVEHVRRRAVLSGAFSDVVVATCDKEIQQAVEKYGGRVIMTSPTHPGATDRVSEAVDHLDCTHVVNVQGDEILILPSDLVRMAEMMKANPEGPAWNAVAPIGHPDELSDNSFVKCTVTLSNKIMFSSRLFPHLLPANVRIVLGVLGYERNFLKRYGAMSRTPCELHESIDQNRIVEHDIPLQGVSFTYGYPGINEPREVALVEKFLANDKAQQAVLEQVLGFETSKV